MPARGWSDPMGLHVVNPNTTEAMTAKIAAAACGVALPGTVIDVRQPEMGPVSIEGFYDEALAVPARAIEFTGQPIVFATTDKRVSLLRRPGLCCGSAGFLSRHQGGLSKQEKEGETEKPKVGTRFVF